MPELPDELAAAVVSLAARYRLPREAARKLGLLLQRLAEDPLAPTSIRDPWDILNRHLADSLVALELEPVRAASLALDLGSGPGIPGLPLAAALPKTRLVLLDANARRCAFLVRTVGACGIANAEVVNDRAETYASTGQRFDLITVRAVARVDVSAEYAAPLLRVGGTLVAWAGRRSQADEMAANRAAEALGLGGLEVRPVEPFPQADNRHLYLMSKVRETPSRFPRRPGIAVKRPLGAPSPARRSSDRTAR